jgi:hypothetical protein
VTPDEIVIVSGLPRSGTSLAMQMLAAGGMPLLVDERRAADADNPRGYFEFEPVKSVAKDASWLAAARGKAVKIVSLLLYDLPPGECYRIVFMERDLTEVLASQRKMLLRRGKPVGADDEMRRSLELHLAKLNVWLDAQPHIAVRRVGYNALLGQPLAEAGRVAEFLGRPLDVERMAAAVDPALYRNRGASSDS